MNAPPPPEIPAPLAPVLSRRRRRPTLPRDVADPDHRLCEALVVFAPLGSAVLDPDDGWVDE